MGLDMYAYSVESDEAINDFEFEGADREAIFYWRKFNALHGWMESLYRHRGGDKEFNCVPLRLYEENLKALLEDANNHKLKPVDGFFFGAQEVDDIDLESIKSFVAKALAEIESGRAVYYDSWW